jgi:hypothetical protein
MNYQASFKKNKGLCSLLVVGFWCLFFVASLLISQGSVYAAQVTLAWDSSDEAAGYKIYYGTTSNNYTFVVDVGNNLNHTFTDLPDGNTYYFAATAYDVSHLESDYSGEVSYNAISDNFLYANFTGYGLYKHDGTALTRINQTVPASMVASGTTLYANFTGYGLYKHDGTTWTQLNTTVPASMVASGTTLYANFTGYGLYKHDGTTWTQINPTIPASMIVSGTTLYANFTGYGLYKHDGTTWTQLNTTVPASMVVSGTTLYANFTGYGLYKHDGTTWTQLNATVPASMVAGF